MTGSDTGADAGAGRGLTDVAGVGVGHAGRGATGVTVVLLPPGTVASAEVRGGAPATREVALLDPVRTVGRVDAIALCGGSAFGLAAADGVVRHLAAAGRGYPTAAGPVPIVPAAAIFDLVASGGARPDEADGHAAAVAAARAVDPGGERGEPGRGRIGAGSGATVGGWRGRAYAVPGGLGQASAVADGATVAALAVVNAVGDVVDADGSVRAGSTAAPGSPPFPDLPVGGDGPGADPAGPAGVIENTTLVVVVTDGRLDKMGCHLVAQSAHHGLAAALRPSHTRFDGDVCFAAATGARPVSVDRLRVVVPDVVAAAVRSAVAAMSGL